MPEPKLTTLAQFRQMKPFQQGYVSYMEAEWPGSELKGKDRNPYEFASDAYRQFDAGQQAAVLVAQDSEE